jgi:hypothetical protein
MVDASAPGSIRTFDDAAALDWLRQERQVETTITDLAKQFGWERTRTSRKVALWVSTGQITRAPGPGGTVITAVEATLAPALRAPVPVMHAVARPIARRALTLPAAVLFIIALGLGGIGLVVNARFAASFGQSDEAATILAMIGLCVDGLSMILPVVSCQLWARGARMAAVLAWCIWPFVVCVSILAALGFAATNITDTLGARAKAISEAAGVRTNVDRLRTERAIISETRSVNELETEVERDRALVKREVWVATRACHDVTVRESAVACATVMATRQALSTAAHRDDIEAKLRVAESAANSAPSISSADPQAEMAAEILDWITGSRLKMRPRDIARLRAIVLALAPSFSGLVLMLALRSCTP